MKFNILNNEPLQFYNAEGVLIGTIEISGSGDMIIRPESGSSRDIILGNQDTVGDVEIGLPSAEANLKLMGGGTISANGNTLTIGDAAAGDQLIFAVPITASNVQTASFAVSASHLIGGGGGGSTDTGSLLVTASVSSNTITFTKGDNTTFPITVDTGSGGGGGGGGSSIFSTVDGYEQTINNLRISQSNSTASLTVINSGSSIFDVQGSVGQLFEVQDGLDGVLMSVNDISGIPILTVSSSGDVILAEGSTLQGTAATASFVAGVSAAFPFAGAAVITGSLDITGSGDDIFKVRSTSGSLFSVDDGLDGILMSVNDISGLPLFEVSSSGDVEIHQGKLSGSFATTASFGHLIVNGTSISGSSGGGGGSTPAGTVSGSAQITELGFVTSSATASFITAAQTSSFMPFSTTGSFNDLIITNLSGSEIPGDGSTSSIAVTVVSTAGGNKYALDGTITASISLTAGNSYKFDQSDSSNGDGGGHPFRFSTDTGGSSNYSTGVTINGTPGSAGAYTQISVTNSTPTLYYYCTNHADMGLGGTLSIITGSLIQNGFLEVSGSTRLSGSLDVLNNITASGDISSSGTITAANFVGVNPFPFTGDAQITGSLIISGSFIPQGKAGSSAVVIGKDASASGNGVSIGQDTSGNGQGISIGRNAVVGQEGVSIGYYAGHNLATGRNINIGTYSAASGQNSMMLRSVLGTGDLNITTPYAFGIYMTSTSYPDFEVIGGTTPGQSKLVSNLLISSSAPVAATASLSVHGSGSTLFEVIGSEGTIFSLDDELDGTLFTVNDRSGIPQLLVSSSGRIEAEEGEAVIRSQRPIVTVATNPFTASLDNAGQYFRVGGNVTCSIFVSASVSCPIGAEFDFFQTSSVGNMLFETGSGVTLNSKNGNLNLAGQFSSATLKYVNNDEWDLMGDLT